MLTALDRYLDCNWPQFRWVKKDDSIVVDLGRGEAVIYCTDDGYRVYYHIDIFWKGAYYDESCIVDSFDGIDSVLSAFKNPDYLPCSGNMERHIE